MPFSALREKLKGNPTRLQQHLICEMTAKEAKHANKGNVHALQQYRYNKFYGVSHAYKDVSLRLLNTEHELREVVQEEISVENEIRKLGPEGDLGERLHDLNIRFHVLKDKWYFYKSSLHAGVLFRAFDLWRSHPRCVVSGSLWLSLFGEGLWFYSSYFLGRTILDPRWHESELRVAKSRRESISMHPPNDPRRDESEPRVAKSRRESISMHPPNNPSRDESEPRVAKSRRESTSMHPPNNPSRDESEPRVAKSCPTYPISARGEEEGKGEESLVGEAFRLAETKGGAALWNCVGAIVAIVFTIGLRDVLREITLNEYPGAGSPTHKAATPTPAPPPNNIQLSVATPKGTNDGASDH
ncbi:hypothetical protein MYU51_010965 [Penicillium brevicompactum]